MAHREHWDRVYRQKPASDASWYQAEATVWLALIRQVALDLDAPIIDVGSGASTLVDSLLDAGYRSISVIDIAGAAPTVAQQRLGEAAALVTWIEYDVLTALLASGYAVWHDPAAFHFLTDPQDRWRYVAKTREAVQEWERTVAVGTCLRP